MLFVDYFFNVHFNVFAIWMDKRYEFIRITLELK